MIFGKLSAICHLQLPPVNTWHLHGMKQRKKEQHRNMFNHVFMRICHLYFHIDQDGVKLTLGLDYSSKCVPAI